MKFLGIDYGSKRVGISLSDDGGILAFPNTVLQNDKNLLEEIKKLCVSENVGQIVLGESLNENGDKNKIMNDIEEFKTVLEEEIKLNVYFEPEFMSSMHADISPEKMPLSRSPRIKNNKIDAVASAIMLQRFLDKR